LEPAIDCVKIQDNCTNCPHACWYCEEWSHYNPKNPKILSPAQEIRKAERKQAKKELKQSDASKRGKANKRKGYRAEKKVADMMGGERVPLSGALRGKYSNDVQADGLQWEVKARGNSFRTLRKWLDDPVEKPDGVILVPDREQPIVCMRMDKFQAYYARRNEE
jgi:hypothetical protein